MVKLKDILDKIWSRLNAIDDYIVERGTRDGWRYVKYNSGRIRLECKQTWTINAWSAWGSSFYSNRTPNLAIPAGLLSTVDFLHITHSLNGEDAVGLIMGGVTLNTKNVPNSYLIRPAAGTGPRTAARYVTLEGTWK